MPYRHLILVLLVTLSGACKKAATCEDGIQNGGELGIDCEGECKNICTPQLHIYDRTNTLLPSAKVSGVAVTNSGRYWLQLGDENGGYGVARFNGDSVWNYYNSGNTDLPTDHIYDIHVSRNDTLWVALLNAGIARFDGGFWTQYSLLNSAIYSNNVVEIAEDKNGNLWLASDVGLMRYDGFFFTNWNTSNSSIPGNDVTAVTVDAAENIWVGTKTNGLAKFNQDTTWIKYNDENSKLPSNEITELARGEGSSVWIGTDQGMVHAKGTSWVHYHPGNSELKGNKIDDILVSKTGIVWVLAGCHYSRFTVNSWSHLASGTGFASFCANDILIDANGKYWIGLDEGLATFK